LIGARCASMLRNLVCENPADRCPVGFESTQDLSEGNHRVT
jgi:hypothetical protein